MLYIFDLDNTLISSYMEAPGKKYDTWSVLPGRKEALASLKAQGHEIAIATNQGGVALGYITVKKVHRKIRQVLQELAIPSAAWKVCYAHPHAGRTKYRDPMELARRKPSGAMLRELIVDYPVSSQGGVVYIGDTSTDQQAAEDAGVKFIPTELFFAPWIHKANSRSNERASSLYTQCSTGEVE